MHPFKGEKVSVLKIFYLVKKKKKAAEQCVSVITGVTKQRGG